MYLSAVAGLADGYRRQGFLGCTDIGAEELSEACVTALRDKEGRPSKWLTLRALQVLERFG